jgi:hypothetical protein
MKAKTDFTRATLDRLPGHAAFLARTTAPLEPMPARMLSTDERKAR